MSSLTSEVTSLKKEVNDSKASLDNKDVMIRQLEESLKAERQKLTVSYSLRSSLQTAHKLQQKKFILNLPWSRSPYLCAVCHLGL